MSMMSFFVTLVSCIAFSFAYIFFLGLRIIRTKFEAEKEGILFIVFFVCSGILGATVSMEAVLLIEVARDVSGRLFYAASAIGVVLLAISTAGVVTMPKPLSAALKERRTLVWGLMVGNPILITINYLSFGGALPSLL